MPIFQMHSNWPIKLLVEKQKKNITRIFLERIQRFQVENIRGIFQSLLDCLPLYLI